jgi:hypothetical protein
MEFINELKSPQDIPEVVGVEWAASDRVVLVCQDGTIRLMGLGLAGTASSASQTITLLRILIYFLTSACYIICRIGPDFWTLFFLLADFR